MAKAMYLDQNMANQCIVIKTYGKTRYGAGKLVQTNVRWLKHMANQCHVELMATQCIVIKTSTYKLIPWDGYLKTHT